MHTKDLEASIKSWKTNAHHGNFPKLVILMVKKIKVYSCSGSFNQTLEDECASRQFAQLVIFNGKKDQSL